MNEPLVRWKALCVDAAHSESVARFWEAILGLERRRDEDGDERLTGARPELTVWVNQVPEAKAVKQRVHLDLEAPALEPILALGATMLLPAEESGFAWSVLADVEGGEFCVFVRDDLDLAAPARLYELIVDTHDTASAHALVAWWAEMLGADVADDPSGFSRTVGLHGAPFASIAAVPVPEPKRVKNRIHWDLFVAHVPALVSRGARVLREPTEDDPWHIMCDPEGNEFCAFAPAVAALDH